MKKEKSKNQSALYEERIFNNKDPLINVLLDETYSYVFWKDKNSIFKGCNRKFALQCGCEESSEIEGKTDYDFPWTDKQREKYLSDDQKIIKTNTPYYHYKEQQTQLDGSIKIILVNKIPIISKDNQIAGIFGKYTDITKQEFLSDKLSNREQECLYFILRGKSAKEISTILNLSSRTVEVYLNNLKLKFNCINKSQLIEFSIVEGYINFMPESLN